MEMTNGSMFAIADLWDAWKDETGRWIQSFAMVTTEANELMAQIHSRIPVMLHERDYDRWLDRGETERLPLDLLRPYEAEALELHEANPKVGKPSNNDPDMLTNPGPSLATFPCAARSDEVFGHARRPVFRRARPPAALQDASTPPVQMFPTRDAVKSAKLMGMMDGLNGRLVGALCGRLFRASNVDGQQGGASIASIYDTPI